MKLRTAISGIIVSLCLSLALASPALSTDGPGFTVKRLVVSQNVVDKEPVGVGETFSADTREVYCFLEAGKIKNDTTVTFAWYFENREMARVSLKLGKGRRWRTYTSKKIGGLKGNWRVELLESSGIVVDSVSFRVQ